MKSNIPARISALFLLWQITPLRAQEWHQGLCQASVDSALSFPVPGVLAKILKKEGDPVKENDVIMELESETEALEVSRQKLAVESARKEFERSKTVFQKGGSVSQEDMEQKEAVWKIAIVEQQQAESQLKRRQLLAPASGVIQDHYGLERGEAVAANSPAARLVDTSHCVFTAYVQGSVAHGFEKGKPVEILLKSGEEEISVAGSIEFVADTVDAASGLQVVRAGFDNKGDRLVAGLPGKMRLQPAKKS